MKHSMKYSMTTARTASSQLDSMTEAAGMDNDSNHPSYKMNMKYCGNQHSGRQDPNRKIDMGRAATNLKGNTGATANTGAKQPPVSGVSAMPAQGSVRDNINRGAQVRTPGGTKEMPKRGRTDFNMARGPTKGNQQ